MREDFEKLPKIANIIPKDSAFMFSEEDNCYFDYDETRRIEGFINGSWYVFQDQQKKLQAVYDDCTEYTTVSELLDSIKGILK